MAGLEQQIIDIRKKYPSMFDVGADNAAGAEGTYLPGPDDNLPATSGDDFTMPSYGADPFTPAPYKPNPAYTNYQYTYPGYTGGSGGGSSGNFGGYEGVSGEGQPAPSPQQIEDRANWRLSQSARVRAGLQEGGGAPSGVSAELEKAIASLRYLNPGSVATVPMMGSMAGFGG